ncbi:hypothetical protein BRADI_2g37642v3 [Brachypodium distachyon]|uniref:Uncharacterized protein n=1 Tax=Brachypodium distachyon TaxID=15368 RepID=A0A2K2DCC8_BRADI|nr:hypothetical protein BRADI_2g37642v3 [Brachypodium distachyon]
MDVATGTLNLVVANTILVLMAKVFLLMSWPMLIRKMKYGRLKTNARKLATIHPKKDLERMITTKTIDKAHFSNSDLNIMQLRLSSIG